MWRRKTGTHNTKPSQPPVNTIASYYHIDLPKEPPIDNMAHVKNPSRLFIAQDFDPTLLNFQRETLVLPLDNQVLLNDSKYMHYSRN